MSFAAGRKNNERRNCCIEMQQFLFIKYKIIPIQPTEFLSCTGDAGCVIIESKIYPDTYI